MRCGSLPLRAVALEPSPSVLMSTRTDKGLCVSPVRVCVCVCVCLGSSMLNSGVGAQHKAATRASATTAADVRMLTGRVEQKRTRRSVCVSAGSLACGARLAFCVCLASFPCFASCVCLSPASLLPPASSPSRVSHTAAPTGLQSGAGIKGGVKRATRRCH